MLVEYRFTANRIHGLLHQQKAQASASAAIETKVVNPEEVIPLDEEDLKVF